MEVPGDPSQNRGFGFIEFKSYKAAAIALEKISAQGNTLTGLPVSLDWAQPVSKVVRLSKSDLCFSERFHFV